ncbi:diguanylate cyclase/phosphodiesterase with PAS/PAC sensor(s) [Spirochaeta thermophila DSM 6578]|uniref:Diguanylate cyclase/phosphodiesterase with PAS/PAC sensor(S) n=1 Tax=Winmispira thermophila (strain ATCC 700085 / DSM 6578 / Z-1203) TaxID=869211 RepID=G0GDU3_WINT7|nr:diguanylate cyclase [Spirochaeta thermophila]AEJ62223.1 diguanylate cyclase/phosphodiesterase with PAS/PAC sensor(s) [Spirochaeta thermophila DSM 6578]
MYMIRQPEAPSARGIPLSRSLTFRIFTTHVVSVLLVLGLMIFISSLFFKSFTTQMAEEEAIEESQRLVDTIEQVGKTLILNALKQEVDRALLLVRQTARHAGEGIVSEGEAQRTVRSTLRSWKIAREGYFVIIDSEGNILLHPSPEVEGTNQLSYWVTAYQTRVKRGYLEYERQNPGEPAPRKKVLYMDYYAPWDWIVTATAYKEEFSELINLTLITTLISSLSADTGMQVFILDGSPVPLASTDPSPEKGLLQQLASLEGDGGFSWSTHHGVRLALAWRTIPDFNWKVVVLQRPILQERIYSSFLLFSLGILGLAFILSLGLSIYFYFSLTRPILRAIPVLRLATAGKLDLRLTELPRNELGLLGAYFNTLMDSLQRTMKEKDSLVERAAFLARFPQENPNPVVFVNEQGRITYVNRSAARIFGLPEGVCDEAIPPSLKGMSPEAEPILQEIKVGDRWYSLIASPSTSPRGTFYFGRETTREREYRTSLLLFRWIFEHAYEGMVVTDEEGNIEMVNPAFTDITGYSEEEARGKTPRILKSDHHPPELYERMWHDLTTKGWWADEIWNRRKSGEVYPEWLSISRFTDTEGKVHYVGIFHEISKQKELEERLRYLAYHDALTDLPNRFLLEDRLERECARARREGKKVGLIFVDLDNFKQVNDTFGHRTGDLYLVHVAHLLREACREVDTVARIAGDEFVIMLPGLAQKAFALSVLERIFRGLREQPFQHENTTLEVSLSAGLAFFPDDGGSASEILSRADIALYRAKRQGKNQYAIFQREDQKVIEEQLGRYDLLRKALAGRTVKIDWEPWENRSGRIAYLEALLSCGKDPTLEPGAILTMAEEVNLGGTVGELIVEGMATLLHGARKRAIPPGTIPPLVARIPSSLLFDHSFLSTLRDMGEAYELPPGHLILLLPFRSGMLPEHLIRAVEEVRTMGFTVGPPGPWIPLDPRDEAIHLPFVLLPYRRLLAFRNEVEGSESSLKALIHLMRYRNQKVVVEGVDDEGGLSWIWELGADLAAGPGVHGRLPAEQVLPLLREHLEEKGEP